MLCFLLFDWTDLLNIQEFRTLGYAILSPFVLIHRDGHLGTCNNCGWFLLLICLTSP
ncbi:Hypothetical predicted protein [Lynx pardinus]|uniref:Uncharacterized protein n=1 Tax=Lynx pardinus TaxID=191816 RepID=A0A485MXK7_LYNPA|nr:Hypothetical predicted protein [Lynx pardinus]